MASHTTVTLCRLYRASEHLPFEQSQSEDQWERFGALLRHSTPRIISSPREFTVNLLKFHLLPLCYVPLFSQKGDICMDKRTKTKAITTVVCLIISVIALYIFGFILDISMGWRIFLILLAISWILSGIINLYTYFKK